MVKKHLRLVVTAPERAVLRLAALGHRNQAIASQLQLAVKAVEAHKASAMRKLGLADRVALVEYGIGQGWYLREDILQRIVERQQQNAQEADRMFAELEAWFAAFDPDPEGA